MEVTARQIAEFLNGEIVGNPDVIGSFPARIEQGRPGAVCFFANPKYEHYVYCTKASILLVNKDFEPKEPVSATMIKVDNAYESVSSLLGYFSSMRKQHGLSFFKRLFTPHRIAWSATIGKGTIIDSYVTIGPKSVIGKNCHIYPNVYIGENVTVGDNVTLYSGVRIYYDCKVGDNCTIHANTVIGADGFGFAPREDGSYKKIPQIGNVVIEDDVEIGANTTVDRATMGSTIVHKGVKIDNLCQIAHNVEIGEHTVMAAMSGIAGSAKVGKYCMIGGQSAVVGHITIADHTSIAGKSGVIGNVRKEGEVLMGYPAIDHKQFLKAYAIFKASGK